MKKSRIVVHLSLEDLRDLGVIRKIYKRSKPIAKSKKETYDFGFKNNPDPNLYNKQYSNYFQNTSNLQNENTRLQNDKLTHEINTLHQGFNNNNEMDNKIRSLENFNNRAISYMQNSNLEDEDLQYRPKEIEYVNNDEDDDDPELETNDDFLSQKNNFNSPSPINSLYTTPSNKTTNLEDNQVTAIKRLENHSEELKNELNNVIEQGSVDKLKQRFQSGTKVKLLSDEERKGHPIYDISDINSSNNDDDNKLTDEQTTTKTIKVIGRNKKIHEDLNNRMREMGIKDPDIFNSNSKKTKENAMVNFRRNQLVAIYHQLGGFDKTQKKTIEGMNKLIKEQISILENPNEKQKNIISDYYKNNE
jgi:hypothetical protein